KVLQRHRVSGFARGALTRGFFVFDGAVHSSSQYLLFTFPWRGGPARVAQARCEKGWGERWADEQFTPPRPLRTKLRGVYHRARDCATRWSCALDPPPPGSLQGRQENSSPVILEAPSPQFHQRLSGDPDRQRLIALDEA